MFEYLLPDTYDRLHVKGVFMEKAIMSLKEVCDYTGWGETKVRQILKNPANKFTVVLGNRLFVNKKLFDEYLEKCAKYHISI